MDDALKRLVVPALRERGFKGSLPHFRRAGDARIDLLTFQFSRSDKPEFVVELAHCPLSGIEHAWGEHVPPTKVTAHDVSPRSRSRLGATEQQHDHWFHYGTASDAEIGVVVDRIIGLLDTQGERYWSSVQNG